MSITISLADDFTPAPLGRNKGREFRDSILLPKIREAEQSNETVVVSMDGAEGFGSSFAEEAFAGLVAEGHYTAKRLRELLKVESNDDGLKSYIDLLWEYVEDAQNSVGIKHA